MAKQRKVRAHVKKKKPTKKVDVKTSPTDTLTKTTPDADAIDSQMKALQDGELVENVKQNDQEKKPEHTNITMAPDYSNVKTNPFYLMNLHQQRQFAQQIGVMKWQTLNGSALVAAIKKKVVTDKLDLFAEAAASVGAKANVRGFTAKLAEGEKITNPKNAVMSHAKVA